MKYVIDSKKKLTKKKQGKDHGQKVSRRSSAVGNFAIKFLFIFKLFELKEYFTVHRSMCRFYFTLK